MEDYKSGAQSWGEFSADVERRSLLNVVGVGPP